MWERIVSGSAGPWSIPIRVVLGGVEAGYRSVVARRNRHFDQLHATAKIPTTVISIGNITVGGTGKTPLVIELVDRLKRLDRRPAVIARGYGSKPGGANDEEILIRKHCPGVIYVSDFDRIRGAAHACRRDRADVIVLDDGFQHRRLARDLDIVVIDATCPFGHEHVLPRGLLREPLTALARAHLIVISRCDQVSISTLEAIESRLGVFAPRTARIRSRHKIVEVHRMDGRIVEGAPDGSLRGKRAVVFAAIGRPRAFVRTVESLGVNVVATHWWRDHHHYKIGDIHEIVVPGKDPPFDVILTTEKDAVKLAALSGYDPAAIMVVQVAIDFLGDGSTIFDESLKSVLARSLKN
ncbi:MAG: tetraacyldisaccharide 4'-kinase [Planctomycetes bacterium]|nr:tetraacyldisaccharide 4'-kinase [Planctomycetota bacterium]MBI3832920.1 tetraacyldisaccharide 4'-kinase [Planctomycetota bacterium]